MEMSPSWEADNLSAFQNYPAFYKIREPCSQQPVTGLYAEPDESSPHNHMLFL
jgi:hypothetical protein